MPDVYRSDQFIPELGGTVRGGITITVHQPDEVEGLIAICELAGQPPEVRIRAIAQALKAAQLNLTDWVKWRRRSLPTDQSPSETWWKLPSTYEGEDDADLLHASLALAVALWKREPPDDSSALSLVLSVADPEATAYPSMVWEGTRPALLFHKGSILADLFDQVARPVSFCVALAFTGSFSSKIRAGNVVKRLRDRAEAQQLKPLPLLNLTDQSFDGWKQSRGLMVFVHGLLSTDLGTFDKLVTELKDNEQWVQVGFPHDTLGSIAENGRKLKDLIQRNSPSTTAPVVFVCHSRGGLVARNAMVQLLQQPKSQWATRIKACVTFGTPHHGSALADAPTSLVAGLLAFKLAADTGHYLSVVDVLCCHAAYGKLPGVADLQSAWKGEGFLHELQQAENQLPRIPIIAVGGKVTPHTWPQRIVVRALGDAESDLVVRLDESLPDFCPESHQHEVECNHSHYFANVESEKYKNIIAQIKKLK